MTTSVEPILYSALQAKTTLDGARCTEDTWSGPSDENKSFAGSVEFRVESGVPPHMMLVSCRSAAVSFGGWNLQIVRGSLSLQIGIGTRWQTVSSSVPVTPGRGTASFSASTTTAS